MPCCKCSSKWKNVPAYSKKCSRICTNVLECAKISKQFWFLNCSTQNKRPFYMKKCSVVKNFKKFSITERNLRGMCIHNMTARHLYGINSGNRSCKKMREKIFWKYICIHSTFHRHVLYCTVVSLTVLEHSEPVLAGGHADATAYVCFFYAETRLFCGQWERSREIVKAFW